MVFSRPESSTYPETWLSFESPKNTDLKFVIKDLSAEHYDTALGYLTNLFLKESGISGPLNIVMDEKAREQMQKVWMLAMESKMAIICMTEDDSLPRVAGLHITMVKSRNSSLDKVNIVMDEKAREQMQKVWMLAMESKMAIICMTEDDSLPRVAGLHITMVKSRNSSLDKKSSATFDTFATVVEEIKNAAQVFDKIGHDYYLGSLGLFVLPEFRNHGIATQLLKARINMCKKLGLKATATVFSTPGAQAAAASAGYKVFAEKTVEEIEKKHGIRVQHNMKMMGRLVD